MTAMIKYVHAISACARDLEGSFPIYGYDLSTLEAAQRWLKTHGVSELGSKHRAYRTEDGGWVFFPRQTTLNSTGSRWWSISIRLDVEAVQKTAGECQCLNHRRR